MQYYNHLLHFNHTNLRHTLSQLKKCCFFKVYKRCFYRDLSDLNVKKTVINYIPTVSLIESGRRSTLLRIERHS